MLDSFVALTLTRQQVADILTELAQNFCVDEDNWPPPQVPYKAEDLTDEVCQALATQYGKALEVLTDEVEDTPDEYWDMLVDNPLIEKLLGLEEPC